MYFFLIYSAWSLSGTPGLLENRDEAENVGEKSKNFVDGSQDGWNLENKVDLFWTWWHIVNTHPAFHVPILSVRSLNPTQKIEIELFWEKD